VRTIAAMVAPSFASSVPNEECRGVRRTIAETVAPSFASSVLNEECRGVRRTIAYHMRSFAHAADISLAPSANDLRSFAAHRSLHQKPLQPTISTLPVQQGKSCLVPSNMERSQLSQNLLCQYL
jgi:hypothetical protein